MKSDLSRTGTNNLDGTLATNDPRFVLEIDPAMAPSPNGNLRLLAGSPALDAGDNAANTEPLDLGGNSRIQNITIDLGTYEGIAPPAIFATFFPGLDPTADANHNGLSNYHDYAAGVDPTAPGDPNVNPNLDRDRRFTLRQRNNASDVFTRREHSPTLFLGSWSQMIENIDYTLDSVTVNGAQNIIALQLLFDPNIDPRMFFRQGFSAAP